MGHQGYLRGVEFSPGAGVTEMQVSGFCCRDPSA